MLGNPYPSCETPERSLLLEYLQQQSITMLKSATAAMSLRSPQTQTSISEFGGGCLAFSGADVPLTRAIGVGTSGPVSLHDVDAVEEFYRSRNSPVRVVISERTHLSLEPILKTRGYQSGNYLQNWWLPIECRNAVGGSNGIEIVPAGLDQADLWARTVAAGFEEEQVPVDENSIPERALDTFYCLGFADGAKPFFAKSHGVIAGGGVLHVAGQTASIRTTSCRVQHRNRGVQSALLAFRLEAAAKAGCRFAFSSTDQPGPPSRNLERFGFSTLSKSFTMSS